jgi:MSHA biogenesis protein MshI
MLWSLNKKSKQKKLLASLSENEIRLFIVENKGGKISVLASTVEQYDSQQTLTEKFSTWCLQNKAKGIECYWLLSRKLYQTYSIKTPEVPASEIDASIKWLIKDQIAQPLNEVLVSHYVPVLIQSEANHVIAVVTDKALIEKIIELSDKAGLSLKTTEINELSGSNILAAEIDNEKIVGLIDEDEQGLIYNFYINSALIFTRHIKGRFFPRQTEQQFSLEQEDLQTLKEQFLLETQRTLDYCVNQVFRRPINALLIDANKTAQNDLVEIIEGVTEIAVTRFESNALTSPQVELQTKLTIAEAGVIFSANLSTKPLINFYFPDYRPKPLQFGLKFATSSAAVFLFGLFIYGLIQERQKTQLNEQLITDNQKLESLQASLLKLQSNRSGKSSEKDIDRSISQKQIELLASRQLLTQIRNKAPHEMTLYSSILAALSEQKTESLWLTKISLRPSRISLSGSTSQADSIPNYIKQISQNQLLNRRFVDLKIERDPRHPQLVNFQMIDGRD